MITKQDSQTPDGTASSQGPLPSLACDLPDEIFWLTDRVQSLLRPAAYLIDKDQRQGHLPLGSTRMGIDVPVSWHASEHMKRSWSDSPYDGESAWFQINLEEIPDAVRKPEWPTCGMVWVFINLHDGWSSRVAFDPRPAAEILWESDAPAAHHKPRAQRRDEGAQPDMARFAIQYTLPWATDLTLPEISADMSWAGLCTSYECWLEKHYAQSPSDFQIGGWVLPCQGDCDERNTDFVCGVTRQEFGDSGAVYLHYTPEKGFFTYVECA